MAGNTQKFTLQFQADTSQAKKQINDILDSLQQINRNSKSNMGISGDLLKASQAAEQLAIHIRRATDANTGKLNFNEFNQSVQQAGQSVKTLISNLSNGGQIGQEAFIKLATAIAQSQAPLRETSKLLKSIGNTLKNTIKWELSSKAIHGLESALSGAVSYVKNLNSSLNDIRIVTGASADDMQRFAIQANKAAKELSTTTKAYADAALIYYQQGDSQEMVAKKAAITIKAANASFGSSTKEMSEYLTAVWNSYQVGADELERYVDIMASLGAKTATSLEEIATSMQKVAATSNTVGVSMEQVSSIIATVSSVTRESAESIGTSFKTIFARIGDLKLGETLEDGIDLGQVSSALDKIGVSILDANGQMRDMGTIIEDLMAKWETMSRAEQTAIAQVVAGKRQYTQLMALMENQDMYQQNMEIAANSDGQTQRMADTYAESWEAASARAKASMETLYQSILNDKFFITVIKGFSTLTDSISGFIKSFGGIGGFLTSLGGTLLSIYGSKLPGMLKNLGNELRVLVQDPKKAYTQNLEQWKHEVSAAADSTNRGSVQATQQLIDKKIQLMQVENSLSNIQKAYFEDSINGMATLINQIAEAESATKHLANSLSSSATEMAKITSTLSDGQQRAAIKQYAQATNSSDYRSQIYDGKTHVSKARMGSIFYSGAQQSILASHLNNATGAYGTGSSIDAAMGLDTDAAKMNQLASVINTIITSASNAKVELTGMLKDADAQPQGVQKLVQDLVSGKIKLEEFKNELSIMQQAVDKNDQAFQKFLSHIQSNLSGADLERFNALWEKLRNSIDLTAEEHAEYNRLKQQFDAQNENMGKELSKLEKSNQVWSNITQGIGGAMQMISAFTSAMNSTTKIFDTFGDSTAGTSEKISAVVSAVMAAGALIMAGMTVFKLATSVFAKSITAEIISIPVIGWIIGIATALIALGGVIAGIINHKEQEAKKLYQQLIDAEKSAQEARLKRSEENAKEIQENEELIASYEELLSKKRAGEDVDADLYSTALTLIDVYGLTGSSLDLLAGKYDSVAEAARQAAVAMGETALTQAEIDINNQKSGIASYIAADGDLALKTNGVIRGNNYNNQYYTADDLYVANNRGRLGFSAVDDNDFTNKYTGSAEYNSWIEYYAAQMSAMGYGGAVANAFGNDTVDFSYINTNTSAKDLVSSGWKQILQETEFDKYLASTYGDINAGLLVSAADSFEYRFNMFEDLQNLLYVELPERFKTMTAEQKASIMGSDLYKTLEAYYNSVKDSFTAFETLTKNARTQAITVLSDQLKTYESVETWSEYSKIYDAMIEWAEKNASILGITAEKGTTEFDDAIAKIVSEIMTSNTKTSNYALVQSAMDEKYANLENASTLTSAVGAIMDKYGPEAITNEVLDGMVAAYENYMQTEGATDAGFISSLGIGTDSENAFIQLGAATYQQAENNTQNGKNPVAELLGQMSADQTKAELNALAEDALNWGANGIIEYSDFLAMTYEEQMGYLESLSAKGAKIMYDDAVAVADAAKVAAEEASKALSTMDHGNYDIWDAQQTSLTTFTSSLDKTTGQWALASGEQADAMYQPILDWLNAEGENRTIDQLTPEVLATLLGDDYIELDDQGKTYQAQYDLATNLGAQAVSAQEAVDLAYLEYMDAEVVQLSTNIDTLSAAASKKPESLEDWYQLYYVYKQVSDGANLATKSLSELMALDDSAFISEMIAVSQAAIGTLSSDDWQTTSNYRSREEFEASLKAYNEEGAAVAGRQGKEFTPVGEQEFLETSEGAQYADTILITEEQRMQLIADSQQSLQESYKAQFSLLQTEQDALINSAQRYNKIWSSINLDDLPKQGTKASELLKASIDDAEKTWDDVFGGSKKESIAAIGEIQRKNIQDQINALDTLKGQAELYAKDTTLTESQRAYWVQQVFDLENQIIDLGLEKDQVDVDVYNDTAALYEQNFKATFTKWEKQIADAKKIAEELKTLGESLSANIVSGDIDANSVQKLIAEGYNMDDWYDSAESRATIVTSIINDAFNREADALMLKQTEISSLLAKTFDSDALKEAMIDQSHFNTWVENLKGVSEEGKAILSSLFDDIQSQLGSKFTGAEVKTALVNALKTAAEEGSEELQTLAENFRTTYFEIVNSMTEAEQQAAQDFVDTWLEAFQIVADAKEGLASGKSLADMYAGDVDSIYALMNASGLSDEEFRTNFYSTGDTMQDSLKMQQWSKVETNKALQAKGMDLLTDSSGVAHTNWDSAYQDWITSNGVDQEALIDAYIQENTKVGEPIPTREEATSAVQSQLDSEFRNDMSDVLKALFPDSTDEDIQDKIDQLMGGEGAEQAWANTTSAMGTFTTAVNLAADSLSKIAEYDIAKAKHEALVADKQDDITQLQEDADQQADFAELANSFYTADSATPLTSILGTQSESEYLAAVNTGLADLGKDQVSTLSDVDRGSWAELQKYFLNEEESLRNQAAVAGQEIVTAGANFKAEVESIFGAESGAPQIEEAEETLEGYEETSADLTESAEVTAAENEATTPEVIREDLITSLASSVDMTTEEFKQFTDAMIEAGEITAETIEGQYEQAQTLARIRTGLKTVRDSMKDWQKALKDTQGDTKAHNKVLSEMRASFEDILDMPTGALNDLSEEFMTSAETAELLEGAMEGDLDSYNQLQAAVAKEMLIADNVEISPKLQAAIDTISTEMDNLPVNQPIAFGELAHVSPQLYAALSEYIGSIAAAGGDVAAAAAGLGFDLQYVQRTIPASAMSYQYEKGGSFTTEDGTFTTVNASLNEETGDYTITAIKAITNNGAHGGGIGGSSGGGGGGGGGGGNKRQKHDKRDKPERYHENTKNYDRVSEALEKVNKAKDRAFGKSYLKNLEKERELLNAQVSLLKEKEDEIQNYYDEDLNNLQNELNALMGVLGGENIQLDIDPNTLNINNWEEIEAKITELYDKKANDKLTDEEWEKIEEQLAKYEEMRDQYEETVALLAENGLTIEDLLNQISEKNLEAITYKVEYQVELNEADLELLEYYKEIFEDDLGSASELMANLANQAGIAQSNLSILETGLNELNAAYAAGEINAADYQEGIADINSQMIDQLSELHDIQNEIAELYAETLDMAQEEMDVHLEHLDHIADVMEHYAEIFDLMGQGTGRAYKNSLMDVQIAANKESLTAQSDLFTELLERKKEFEANMDENGNFSTELEQQQYEALLETLTEVHGNMMDTVAEGMDLLAAKYENTIEKIFEDFEERMLGANQSIADVADKYEYYQETQNRQLSAAQELYEMSKLNREIEQSIEDSTTKANKQILKDLQAQINARAELKDMTEYDIEMMNLQYQLALKQMALEDAQNAKSVVRLTRDNDGNYAYQYTADDDKVASAYQEYEDVLQQINDLASGRVGELEQAMLDAQQEYADAAKEIALDMTLTETERQAKLEELAKRYEETLLYIQEEYGYATGDLKNNLAATSDWYNTTLVEDSSAAQEQVADMIKNAETWAQEYANMLTGENGSVLSTWKDYADAIATMSEFMETALTEEGMNNYKDAAEAAGKAAADVVTMLGDELTDINAVTQAWKDQAAAMDEAIKRYETLAAKMNDVMRMLAELEEAQGPALGDASSNTSDDGKDVSFADPEILAAVFGEELASQYTEGKITQDQLLAEIIGTVDKTKVQWDDLEDAMQVLWEYQLDKDKDEANEEYKKAKELIDATGLNLEEIWAQLEAQTQAEMANMSSWAMAQTLIKDSTVNYNTTQNITMTNEFPNVESIEDIKQAFEELFLYASQYVNGDGGRAAGSKGGGGGGGGGHKTRPSPPPV